jgi:hypothetical protein
MLQLSYRLSCNQAALRICIFKRGVSQGSNGGTTYYSYDESENLARAGHRCNHVKDEDLIYLKMYYPADQVRLSAAGVEVSMLICSE